MPKVKKPEGRERVRVHGREREREREREDSLNEMGREDFSEGREGSRRKNKSTELLKKK